MTPVTLSPTSPITQTVPPHAPHPSFEANAEPEFCAQNCKPPAPAGLVTPIGMATQLLSDRADQRAGNFHRIALGAAGLFTLAAASSSAFHPRLELPGATVTPLQWATSLFHHSVSLPIAAALTLALSLPGLFILLRMMDEALSPQDLLHAVCREYARFGLLSCGLAPVVALYALTGASDAFVVALTGVGYLGFGALAFSRLCIRVIQALKRKLWRSQLTVALWSLYTGMLALYFYVKAIQNF